MNDLPFGRTLLGARPAEVLAADAAASKANTFAQQEALLARLLERAQRRERLIIIDHGDRKQLRLAGLNAAEEATVEDQYSLARQEARGAWFLPQDATVRAGFANLAWHVAGHSRFAVNAVRDDGSKFDLRTSSHAVATWVLIGPMFDALFAPIDLRTSTSKLPTPAEAAATWGAVLERYDQLGLDCGDALVVFQPDGPWSKLRFPGQIEARERLIDRILTQTTDDTVRRWRAFVVQELVAAYYKKWKRGTAPLARSVLTKPLQPALAAYFGGDWLTFIGYLGEQPADGEVIATALPQTKLFVGASSARVVDVAAQHGLTVDEVQQMLGVMLGARAGVSPVEERVDVMRRWWKHYDAVHADQKPGMTALWGLVDEGGLTVGIGSAPELGLYKRLIPRDIVVDIDRLWEGTTLTRWPERIVSQFFPHRQMAQAFGPALEFWNGVALTCWYVCEGPSSRTSLDQLAHYHRRVLQDLEDAGFGVDPGLFRELLEAEQRLGPEEILEDEREIGAELGITVTVSFSRGSRRDGFELLRDIVTRHRRAWAAIHLDAYLRQRWDGQLRSVSREFHRRLTAKGKPPTLKQFAVFAADAANNWFNGDISAVLAAFGERSHGVSERIDLLAGDPIAFVLSVFTAMGGVADLPADASWKDREAFDRNWQAARLANDATRYLQIFEALGAPPSPEDFGADKVNWVPYGGLLVGWTRYEAAIESARRVPASLPPPRPPPADALFRGLPAPLPGYSSVPAPPTLPGPPLAPPPSPPEPPAAPPTKRSLISRLRRD